MVDCAVIFTATGGCLKGSTLLFAVGNENELDVIETVGICVDVLKGLLRGAGTGVGTGVGTVAGAGRVTTGASPEEANGLISFFFVGVVADVSGTAGVPTVDESKISEPAIFRGPVADARPALEDVANGLNGTDIF